MHQTPTKIITKSVESENDSLELVEIEPPTKYEPPTKKHRILASLESFVNILNTVFENEEEVRHIDDNKYQLNQHESIRRIIRILFTSSGILSIFLVGLFLILTILSRQPSHGNAILQIQKSNNRGRFKLCYLVRYYLKIYLCI